MFVGMFVLPMLPSLIGNSLYLYKEPASLAPYHGEVKTTQVDFKGGKTPMDMASVRRIEVPWFKYIDLHKLLHKYYCKRK
jgi:hypothetical protein